jgi:putative transposase
MVKFKRSRTPSKYIYYALHLYFSGLSLRKTSEHLLPFIKRNHVSIWNWIQHYKPTKIWQKRTKISQFIIDETLVRVGREEVVWLWIAIEPKSKSILDVRISLERSMLVAEQFLQELIKKYGKNPVSTDGGTWYPSQACRFLKLRHHIHSYYERSIIERTIQYIKDRTECFDDYFPCQKDNCTLEHVRNWFNLFVDVHNSMVVFAK